MPIRTTQYINQMEAANFADDNATDEKLLSQVKQNNTRAFGILMTRHRGLIWSAVKQYFGSYNEAEDIFQDVSISVYQHCQAISFENTKFSSWLYRVTANKCIDILRKRKLNGASVELLDSLPSMEKSSEENISDKANFC